MASVSFKIQILKQKQKKDKTYPVTIRVGWKSSYSYIFTDYCVSKEDLTKDFNVKNTKIIDKCNLLIKKYRDAVSEIEDLNSLSVKKIVEIITYDKTNKELDFMAFFKAVVKKMKVEKGASYSIYNPALNHLIGFYGDKILPIDQITAGFIQKYQEYLKGKEVGLNGQLSYLGKTRAVYNKCMDEYEHLGYMFRYPFRRFKMPTVKPRSSSTLTKEQILSILNYQPKTKKEERAQATFAITLFTSGANAKDLFELKESKNGRIEYERSKTKGKRSDNAFISLSIQPELIPYIEKYKGENGYLFCFNKWHSNNKQLNRTISVGLISIADELEIPHFEYYDVRRTIASVMRNKLGISKDDVAMCLNHVDMNHKTTDYYIDVDFSIIDKCNRKFLDWLFNPHCNQSPLKTVKIDQITIILSNFQSF